MPARSRSKDGVASHAHVAGIRVSKGLSCKEDVDGLDKPGHDAGCPFAVYPCSSAIVLMMVAPAILDAR